ncbi:histidinol dehydrogenase [Candidatus Xianfuyuplasma coldseepsis]|uniref:Histidinol dehydrogenase n=1 Tax=Candidatus Xianfuyuplasma coldseepsis TaxID=2782163 RepID=A0A7L7KPR4_9MOLU|nr:histidinol dehydrogenase [Xianfuyuplasma coldseepsis]QMS84780.1 histidinol dehydrogenase [Xianfuyuplasma coldseepsis]
MITTYTKEEFINLPKEKTAFNSKQINTVKQIINDVQLRQDDALREYTLLFDKVDIENFKISQDQIDVAYQTCDPLLRQDLEIAFQNILSYHEQQRQKGYQISLDDDSYIGQLIRPIERVGIYVPGGTAAYPSTVLMNAAPAIIAGVKEIAMISPPTTNKTIAPIILVAAKIAGINEIYQIGGAQGIAALAYGTPSIPKVNKIVGPGNIYVALAKREVYGTVGIDMIAGPSEIMIYADESSNPRFIAADLLSQAEHDILARPLLVTTSPIIIPLVQEELSKQLAQLSRQQIAIQSLRDYGAIILVDNEAEAIEMINRVAPEHLELLQQNPEKSIPQIQNAGAIFVGPYSPEPLGDYMAGPNHTLPTSGTATFSSALSVGDFITKTSVISYSKARLYQAKDRIVRIATKEGLTAHANAISVRYTNENE